VDPFDLEFLLRALSGGATLAGTGLTAECRFTGVTTDSRKVAPGDLFVALEGARADGNLFVDDALDRGAAGAIAREDARFRPRPGRPVLLVREPLRALGSLAAAYRRRLPAAVVGITGSAGKTTTRELLYQLLADPLAPPPAGEEGAVVRAEKSFNNALGVPLTIFRATRATRVLILEIGTSGPGEIGALARIALPEVAVVTNVGAAHLDGLGTIDGVAREKGALVEGLRDFGTAVLNADDPRVAAMRARLPARCGAVLYGTSGAAQVRGVILPEGARARLEVRIAGAGETAVTLPFPGRHNAMNALAAIAAVHALGRDAIALAARLEAARLPGRRLEALRLGPVEIIDDAYNANPASTAAALEVLASFPGRRIFVFGGMRELGAERERLHREIGALAARAGLAVFCGVGEDAAIAVSAARAAGLAADRTLACPTPEAAAEALAPALAEGGTVLVKGSRAAALERFIARLGALLGAPEGLAR
jgi:UDP-N-acetylmuramoyl-tripeptide--D-alanyl-D-alanine ligase